MLGQNSQAISLQTYTRKQVHIEYAVSANSWRGPTACWPNAYRCLSVDHFEFLMYSAPAEKKETPHERNFYECQNIRNRPRDSKIVTLSIT
jgi:hypothetical protein